MVIGRGIQAAVCYTPPRVIVNTFNAAKNSIPNMQNNPMCAIFTHIIRNENKTALSLLRIIYGRVETNIKVRMVWINGNHFSSSVS